MGPRRVIDLLTRMGSADAVLEYVLENQRVPERVRSFVETASPDQYALVIKRTFELGGDFKLWNDADYPSNLSKWDGRPPVLFYKGEISGIGRRALALVGRVDPTDEGLAAADRFARKCVDAGISVVSGLAKGIDGASHRAALRPPAGRTYAVVGHGIDYTYPRENIDLYKQMTHSGGILSQFPTGMGPQRWTFPARNEVMCTLALGTVIIEGKTSCGSIIQADFSFKHQRPVFLLGRNLKAPDSQWAHDLVRRGATVIERFDQVLEIVEREVGHLWSETEAAQETLFATGELSLLSESMTGQEGTARMSKPPLKAADPPGAILFDIDGVVVDTRHASTVALAAVASAVLKRDVSPNEVRATGKPHEALALLGVSNAYNIYRQNYDAAFRRACADVRVFQRVVEGIRMLKNSGYRVGAVTAQPARRINAALPRDVRDLFDVFLCYNDTLGKKDDGIRLALQRLGVGRERAMYIGDQATDLEAARRAGVRAVGVLWGFSSEDELRRWPHDLLISEHAEVGPNLPGVLFQDRKA